jgi:hypothetical protein
MGTKTSRGSGHPRAKKQAGKLPAEYKALRSPTAKVSWLRGDVAKSLVRSGQLQQSQVEGEERRLGKEARRVALEVATPTLLEDWQRGNAFPPRAESTPMRQAAEVVRAPDESDVLWPFYYLTSGGHLWELHLLHAYQRAREIEGLHPRGPTTSSPTAVALQAAADRNAEILEVKLDPEDGEALLEEIKSVHAGRWRRLDLNGEVWEGV